MKKLLTLSLAVLAVISASASVYAQNEEDEKEKELQTIYITAPSKFKESSKTAATSVTVLTEEDIETSGQTTLPEILRTTSAVGVSTNGGPGNLTTLRIRGEEGYRTHVYVDGVRNVDVTAPQATPRLEHIKLKGIERIEVLRGAQGFVYGADAGGIVNIITRQGRGELKANYTQSRGSDNAVDTSVGLSAGNDQGDFYIAASDYKTDGFNSRSDDVENEDDGYENNTFHGKFGVNANNNLRFQMVINKVNADSEYDPQFGGTNDLLNKFSQLNNNLSAEYKSSAMEHNFSIGQSKTGTDIFEEGVKDRFTDAKVRTMEYYSVLKQKKSTVIFGIESEKQTNIRDEISYTNIGKFIEYKDRHFDNFFVDIGLRQDENSDYGEHLSTRLSASYVVDSGNGEYKVRSSVGSGFRAPSLFETTNLAPGVDSLKEEKSKGYDAGADWYGNNGSVVSIVYFNQEITDEIGYVGTFPDAGYSQVIGKSSSKGVELFLLIPLNTYWTLSSNYTYNDTKDMNGEQRARRPKHLANLGAKYTGEKLVGSFNLRGLKDVVDTDSDKLDNYIVANVGFTYTLQSSVSIFGSVNNLFNKEYEEVRGYNTPDRNFTLGTTISF